MHCRDHKDQNAPGFQPAVMCARTPVPYARFDLRRRSSRMADLEAKSEGLDGAVRRQSP
jgi:hypothetical protein